MKKFIAIPEVFNDDPPTSTVMTSIRGMETLLALFATAGKFRPDPDKEEMGRRINNMVALVEKWGPEETVCRQAELECLKEGIELSDKMLIEVLGKLVQDKRIKRPTLESCQAHEKVRTGRLP